MPSTHPNRNLWFSTGVMLACLFGVWLAEEREQLTPVRMWLQTAISPGRLAVLSIGQLKNDTTSTDTEASTTELAALQNALLKNELQRRRLLIENARLQNELRNTARLDPIRTIESPDLVDFVTVNANILSHKGMSGRFRETIIDAGRAHQLQPSQLVVDGTGLLIDKGSDQRIAAGQKVAQGTAVVGRIVDVAAWVSLVQPVTSVDFSAAVQIVKLEPHAASFGAKGLLEGMGTDHCRITGIAYTEAVAVGDEVFSAAIDGVAGPRLYFGQVSKADFTAGGQWDIEVAPAFAQQQLTKVAVIRPEISAASQTQSRRSPESRP